MTKAFRMTNDGALGLHAENIGEVSEDGITIAVMRFNKDHGLNFMWLPHLFTNEVLPLNDVVREAMVELLRFHANMLESREVDRRMKEIAAQLDKGGTT